MRGRWQKKKPDEVTSNRLTEELSPRLPVLAQIRGCDPAEERDGHRQLDAYLAV